MNMILRKLHFYWYMTMVALVFFIFYPAFYFYTKKEERFPSVGAWRKIWCQIAFLLGFYWYKIEYEEDVDFSKPLILVANHTSFLDTPLICMIARGNYHFMGKVELLKNPVLKLFFQTIDVPVDRANRIASYRALKRVEDNIRKGMSLILYPEGTMARNAPTMGEFKAGAFKLAVDTKVDILPITFVNNYALLPNNGSKTGSVPGIMKVYVHKPISTSQIQNEQDLEQLSQQVFNTIQSKLPA
jgi:1-acyl-sn-glycerol-3-phosphate acyltransferase